MDYKPCEVKSGSGDRIVTTEIAHFWSVVLAGIAIVGGLYAYDAAIAQGLPSHPQPNAGHFSHQALLASPFQCRENVSVAQESH